MESKYLIKKEFLQPLKYQQLLQEAQTYEQIFKQWLSIISEDYRGSNKPPIILPTLAADKKTDNIALKMQGLIIPLLNSLYDMSSQHIEYVSDLAKPAALNSLRKQTEKVILSVKNYNSQQERILTTFKELLSAQSRLIITPTPNVQFYFTSNWSKRLASFEKYITAVKNISPDLINVDKFYKQSGEIQIELLDYRKKILTFKYGVLKQGIKMARKLLVCFSEYILIGNQMLSKVNDKLRQRMSDQYKRSQSFTSYDFNSKEYHENFALKAQTFRDTLYKIRNMFESHQDPVESNRLIMKLKQAYVGNQYLLVEIQDVFNLFEFFGTKKKEIVERMNETIKKMDGWYSQNRKAVEVYNTLNRHSNILQVNGNDRLRKSSGFKSESSSEIESVEQAIAQCMEHSFQIYYEMGQSCQKLSQKIIQPLNTQTNMSVSYQYQEIKIKHKRPSKNQIWLWKDWRDFGGFEEMKPKYEEPFLNKEASKMKDLFDVDQEDMKVSCDLEGRYHCQARMLVYPQKVKIVSKRDDKVDIILPFSQMESVEVVKKKLLIKMAGGAQIKCSGFKKVHEVENKISEYLQAKSEGGNGSASAPSKPVIEITAEELEAISKRSSQIQALKQKMDDYAKYGETTLTNVSIQQVYDCIFSDKNNSPLSKSMSFFQYTNHKSGNLNYKEEKYNKPGPYYYTGEDKEITFVNSPLFSERVIMLDHPLPPIPFVPKVAHVKSKDKILWISDKQLQYQSLATSSGSDMMESFYTVNLYKIKEVQKNTVQIEIHCKMVFVKETRMKSILLNGAINELKVVIPGIVLQIEKSMKAHVRSRSKGSAQAGDKGSQEQDEEQDENLQGKKENSQQSMGTKYLALFVIGTILLNVIIHLLF